MTAWKGTPAPWELRPHAKFGSTQMYWVNDNTSVGTEIEADAQGIAAVPQLVEALVEILALMPKGRTHVEAKVEAVARAALKAAGVEL